jgi:hypothetical protein
MTETYRTQLILVTTGTAMSSDIKPQAVFESASPASEQLQTHALDRVATGIGTLNPLNAELTFWQPSFTFKF